MNAEFLRPDFPGQPVILVADDEVLILNIARISLEREGYFVLTAENGEEALSLSRQYSGEIHVLISDVEMPKMNGLDLTSHITNERPETQVVLMSGWCEATNSKRPFLRKPFVPTLLTETVRRLLAVCQE